MDQKDILEALRKVKHPETGNDIVSQGMVENLVVNDSKIQFTLSKILLGICHQILIGITCDD